MQWPNKIAQQIASVAGALRQAVGGAPPVSARYEAGSRRKRLSSWTGSRSGINTETKRSLRLIRQRSRDLVANHWAAQRAKAVIASNVIGSGIKPTAKDNEALSELLYRVCSGTQLDPRRRKTLYAIQELALGAVVESGECLIVRQRRTRSQMQRLRIDIPLQIQVLEADYLDELVDGMLPNGNFAIQGVEFDDIGAIVAYHLFEQHPGEVFQWSRQESRRVPAEDVIHLFEEWRPGQVRGLPWGVSAMVKMRDLSDYEDAQLLKQKLSAALVGFIKDSGIGGPLDPLFDNNGVPETLSPGTMEYLRPGEDVVFSTPPQVSGFKDFSQINARAIAAAYNVTYESLTNDYSNVNFSSGRMGWIEMQRYIEHWQSDLMVAQMCLRVEEWIREAAQVMGIDASGPAWKWTPPRREMIDPVKETAAALAAVRGGLNSMPDEITKMGRMPEEVAQEIAAWNALIDSMGIVLDSDPRRMSQAGQTQPDTSDED